MSLIGSHNFNPTGSKLVFINDRRDQNFGLSTLALMLLEACTHCLSKLFMITQINTKTQINESVGLKTRILILRKF